jgi:RNA polymerase sigma factor (sigma-70 family)
VNDISEQRLLEDFAKTRSESAFAELARRRADLVYSAALRLTANSDAARDVTQAVFVALASQAGRIARKLADGAPLSGWLHLTTRNLAAKTVRAEVRRRAREQEAVFMQKLSSDESAVWEELSPHLDHALGDLSEPDRDLLLLRFFETKTIREIGDHLGIQEEAAKKRIARALERLRERFAERGVVASSTTIATLVAAKSVEAAPIAIVATLNQAALAAATAPALTWLPTLFSSVSMTKTQISALASFAAVLAIPIAVQQTTLHSLRTETRSFPGSQEIAAPQQTADVSRATPESEAEEITRLRRTAKNFRAQLAAKNSSPPISQATASRAAGPTLLAKGKRVALSDLIFAGNDTPEAALQSMLVCRRDGDVEGAEDLLLLSPEQAEKWREMLATPGARDQMAREMSASARGAVMESAAEKAADGSIVGTTERVKELDGSEPVQFEITKKTQLDERRVQVEARFIRGNAAQSDTMTFGLTAGGWKGIP